MLVGKKTSIYFAIEISLREVSFVVYVHALMTQKSCAVRMRNAILRNHLKHSKRFEPRSIRSSVKTGVTNNYTFQNYKYMRMVTVHNSTRDFTVDVLWSNFGAAQFLLLSSSSSSSSFDHTYSITI